MDFVSKTLISTITTPAAVRSIAYDSDLDGFWYNNFSTDLHFVNRSGTLLNTITAPPSMYGCAYDNLSFGGPFLWIFTGTTTGGGCQVEQYDLATETLTGLSHSVSGDLGAYIAGGLWLQPNLVSGTYTLGGMAQGTPDLVFGYEIGTSLGFYNLVDNKTNAEVGVNNYVLISNNLTVRPDADLTNNSGNTVDVSGNVLLEADDTGMASYLDNGTTNVAGVSSVEQYIEFDAGAGWQWHLVSAPISDATIQTYYDMFLYTYHEDGNAPGGGYWENLWDPMTIPMDVGQGYNITGSNTWIGTTTVSYTTGTLGTLNSSDVTLTGFTRDDPDASFRGFELVGNPFPCAIDWNNDVDWTRTGLSGWAIILDDGTYRGWHPTMGGYGSKTDGIIPATQGFFVRATSLPATLVIPASQRVHNNQAFYKETEEFIYPIVRLEASVNGQIDESVVAFHPEGHTGFDDYYDLNKFTNAEGMPNLYSVSEGSKYAFNVLPEEYAEMIIPVYFEISSDGICQVEATEINNISDEINVYLEDLKEETVTELKANPIYEFSYDPLDNPHRFNLHFTEGSLDVNDYPISSVNVYSFEDVVYIQTGEIYEGTISIYDMLGQEIIFKKINNKELISIPVTKGTGYYLVKVQSDKGLVTKKVFIR